MALSDTTLYLLLVRHLVLFKTQGLLLRSIMPRGRPRQVVQPEQPPLEELARPEQPEQPVLALAQPGLDQPILNVDQNNPAAFAWLQQPGNFNPHMPLRFTTLNIKHQYRLFRLTALEKEILRCFKVSYTKTWSNGLRCMIKLRSTTCGLRIRLIET